MEDKRVGKIECVSCNEILKREEDVFGILNMVRVESQEKKGEEKIEEQLRVEEKIEIKESEPILEENEERMYSKLLLNKNFYTQKHRNPKREREQKYEERRGNKINGG